MKRKIIIQYSQEDKAYIAIMPSLPGCMADGQTYQEALETIIEVARDWLLICVESGWDTPPVDIDMMENPIKDGLLFLLALERDKKAAWYKGYLQASVAAVSHTSTGDAEREKARGELEEVEEIIGRLKR